MRRPCADWIAERLETARRRARHCAPRLRDDRPAAKLCFGQAKQAHRLERRLACSGALPSAQRRPLASAFLNSPRRICTSAVPIARLRLEGGRLRAVREREHRVRVGGGAREIALRDEAFRAKVEQVEPARDARACRGQAPRSRARSPSRAARPTRGRECARRSEPARRHAASPCAAPAISSVSLDSAICRSKSPNACESSRSRHAPRGTGRQCPSRAIRFRIGELAAR